MENTRTSRSFQVRITAFKNVNLFGNKFFHLNYFLNRKLAKEAEANMEAVQPPLFLRFINLLINDAVFLLDDALANMAQLRQLHRKKSFFYF